MLTHRHDAAVIDESIPMARKRFWGGRPGRDQAHVGDSTGRSYRQQSDPPASHLALSAQGPPGAHSSDGVRKRVALGQELAVSACRTCESPSRLCLDSCTTHEFYTAAQRNLPSLARIILQPAPECSSETSTVIVGGDHMISVWDGTHHTSCDQAHPPPRTWAIA
jgi:hypothetical protein